MRRMMVILLVFILFLATYLLLSKSFVTTSGLTSTKENDEEFHMLTQMKLKKKSEPSLHFIEGKEVHELISTMTLDEKIGQLIIGGVSGTELSIDDKKLLHTYKLGGFILFSHNLVDVNQSVKLINSLKAENTNKQLPLLLSVDQEGGEVVRLPDQRSLKTNKEIAKLGGENVFKTGRLLGKQLKEFGLNMNFAPVVDINSNPKNPVIGDRSFGSDKLIVSELGIQMMKGMQGEKVISVLKHFPGHGDTSIDSHHDLPVVDKGYEELKEMELFPFENAIHAGGDVIMTAHILLPELDPSSPATLSRKVITNVLREDLDFAGVVITDDLTMGAINDKYEIGEAAVLAVEAGVDIVLVAHHQENIVEAFNGLKEAVQEGRLDEKRLEESLYRIISLKKNYGLQDKKIKNIDVDTLNKEIDRLYEG